MLVFVVLMWAAVCPSVVACVWYWCELVLSDLGGVGVCAAPLWCKVSVVKCVGLWVAVVVDFAGLMSTMDQEVPDGQASSLWV